MASIKTWTLQSTPFTEMSLEKSKRVLRSEDVKIPGINQEVMRGVMILTCKRILLLSLSIAILVAFVPKAFAQQSATASISGTVKDSVGALVTGAQITVTQKATGIKRETTSNGDGFFAITNMASGIYEMKVRAKGFAEKIIPGINLQVGQTFDLEVPMAVTVQETVTLDDRFNYELVNKTTAVVDGVIRDFEIENLPLNARNFL